MARYHSVEADRFGQNSPGRPVRCPQGCMAFVPNPLEPSLNLDMPLVAALSGADRALSELAGVARTPPGPLAGVPSKIAGGSFFGVGAPSRRRSVPVSCADEPSDQQADRHDTALGGVPSARLRTGPFFFGRARGRRCARAGLPRIAGFSDAEVWDHQRFRRGADLDVMVGERVAVRAPRARVRPPASASAYPGSSRASSPQGSL